MPRRATPHIESPLAVLPTTKHPRSRRVIIASLCADGTLAVLKCVAALLSGSAAMFAEAMHSIADTTNQSLLLVGIRLGAKPADAAHPFGYGMERFFWPFVVSMVVCSVGGVFSVWRGVDQIRSPHALENLVLNYRILLAAFVLEGTAWIVAWLELRRSERRQSLWRTIRESKSASVVAVFLQDAAAVIGVCIAAAGMWLAARTGLWMLDGVASILIGALLFNVAWVLAVETKSLLIGESASPEHIEKIRAVVDATEQVEQVLDMLTMHLSPDEILLNLDLAFKDGLTTDQIEAAIDHLERHIRAAIPEVNKIFIEAESIAKVVRQSEPPKR